MKILITIFFLILAVTSLIYFNLYQGWFLGGIKIAEALKATPVDRAGFGWGMFTLIGNNILGGICYASFALMAQKKIMSR